MKNLIFFSFFILTASMAKAQCIRIYVSEKIKGIEIPIGRREFEVYVNDTLKKKIESDASGYLTRLSLEKGKYNIKIVSTEYASTPVNDVVVEESKSTDITIIVSTPAAVIPEKKK